MRMVGHLKTIYTIRDSDEMYVVGHAPTSYQPSPLNRQKYGELGKGAMFRASYYGNHFNWLHRTMFFVPVRIHAGPLNDKWDFVEKRALQTLLTGSTGLSNLGRWVKTI